MQDKSSSSQKQLSKTRKIRCIQDFEALNRSSLSTSQSITSIDSIKTKKLHKLDFLPKVNLINESSTEKSIENNSNSSYHKKKNMQLTPTISQVSFNTVNDNCNSILSSPTDEDYDIYFKVKHKKKQSTTTKTLNGIDSTQSITTPNMIPEKPENVEKSSKPGKHTLQKKKNRSKSTNKCKNSMSRSFKILRNPITPDTSGNNQGLFEVTNPIEEEFYTYSHSSLDLTENNFKNNPLSIKLEKTLSSSEAKLTGQDTQLDDSMTDIRTSNGSVINLITPSPQKSHSLSEKLLSTPTPTSTPTSIRRLEHNQYTKATTSLIRSGTFTKEDDNIQVKLNSSQGPNSVLNVTKGSRKRWTKILGVSVLDNSGNIQPISAPLSNDSLLHSPAHISNSISHHSKKCISILSPLHLIASTPMTMNEKNKEDSFKVSNKKDIGISINKTKMPNFARIHQKAYDKLENIKEMSERKAARAQKLLSGHKPEIYVIKKSPGKSRKALNYNHVQKQFVNDKPEMKFKVIKPLQKDESVKNILKNVQRKINSYQGKSYLPVPNNHNTKITIENKMNTKKKSLEKKGIQKTVISTAKSVMKKVPFEKENLKALANKKPNITDTVEKRRKFVQNIRTNRRFELLMKMRNK